MRRHRGSCKEEAFFICPVERRTMPLHCRRYTYRCILPLILCTLKAHFSYSRWSDNLFVVVSPVCASVSSRIRGEPIGLVLLYLRPCACTSAGMAGRACRLGRSKFACTTRRLTMPAVVRGNRYGEPHLNMAACHILVWSSGLAVTSGHR